MKVELKIALRYLLSRKSHGAVNVISAVAMAGVCVAAASMIVVLSVFNGFAKLVDSRTSLFNPPLLINRTDGGVIANADSLAASLDVAAFPIIDQQAFAISANGQQMPVNFRALPARALPFTGIESILVDGEIDSAAILSVGVAMQLNLRAGDSISIYLPRRIGRINPGAPQKSFSTTTLPVSAIYQVEQEEQDRDMLLIPLSVARELLSYTTEASAVALYPVSTTATHAPSAGLKNVPSSKSFSVAPPYQTLDRRAQEADSFRMIAIEKWITFLMLAFILVIASFNVISTLSLMIIEKEGNMSVLRAMGATPRFIGNIFANQAWLITMGGGIIGLLLGSLLILGQQHYGWIPLSTTNPAILATTSYPVDLTIPDLLIVFFTLLLLSLFLSLATSRVRDFRRTLK